MICSIYLESEEKSGFGRWYSQSLRAHLIVVGGVGGANGANLKSNS